MNDVEVTLARHDERLKSLENCFRQTSTSLTRIEGKVDKIYKWILGLLGTLFIAMLPLILRGV